MSGMQLIIENWELISTILLLAAGPFGWAGHVLAVKRLADPLVEAMDSSKADNRDLVTLLEKKGKKAALKHFRRQLVKKVTE